MPDHLLDALPHEAPKIALVLLLSFFVGLEREEHKQRDAHYAFGGVRTFPLIGLIGYMLALLSGTETLPWTLGFLVVAAFMLVSYRHKLTRAGSAGLTTEVSGLATYLMGVLVFGERYWIAATISVLSVFLLELKLALERLTAKVESSEIITFATFLLLAVVVLPILPNEDFTQFDLNPFKVWLVVVAVSGVSWASYVVQRLTRDRGGPFLTALLCGAYSSTATTVVLSRRARTMAQPTLYSGSILAASGMMYLRVTLLLALFNGALFVWLAPWFLSFAALAIAGGWAVTRIGHVQRTVVAREAPVHNPLELRAAFMFAILFVVILIVTALAREYLGRTGFYGLAVLIGLTDVDPFILGLAQAKDTALDLAGFGIVIAAASNNLSKAAYAFGFADRATGKRSAALLVVLALVGALPLLLHF